MKRTFLIAAATAASILAVTSTASARLGMAPLAAPEEAVIQVKGGHGHGHGHWHHRGSGHHYGWYRGRHRGWHHRHH